MQINTLAQENKRVPSTDNYAASGAEAREDTFRLWSGPSTSFRKAVTALPLQ